MARKRRSSYSSASTDDSDDEPVRPPAKRTAAPVASTSAAASTSSASYLSPQTILGRRAAMLTVVNAMPEAQLKSTASKESWSHHYALQKRCPAEIQPLDPSLPRNLVWPESLSYPQKTPDAVRMVFWNINGILDSGRHFSTDYKKSIDISHGQTSEKSTTSTKAIQAYIRAEDPDFVCIAETKLNSDLTIEEAENQLPEIKRRFPYRIWARADESGYAGVAIFTKFKPLSSITGLPDAPEDVNPEGRLVCLEFEKCYVLSVYVPHSGIPGTMDKLRLRAKWDLAFRKYVHGLLKTKAVIIAGDFNVTPTDKDLRRPEYHLNRTGGVIKQERQAWIELCYPKQIPDEILIDSWRELHPWMVGHYTYTGHSKNHREHGEGLRIDTFLVSNNLYNKVRACNIRHDAFGASDHLPVAFDIAKDVFQ